MNWDFFSKFKRKQSNQKKMTAHCTTCDAYYDPTPENMKFHLHQEQQNEQ